MAICSAMENKIGHSMTSILFDHNIRGYFELFTGTLSAVDREGSVYIQFLLFSDVGLPNESTDQVIWNFVQEKQMFLLTNNRNRKGADSLQEAIESNTSFESIPVLTIGNVDRIYDRYYRERSIARIAEIATNLENYRGCGRLFVP